MTLSHPKVGIIGGTGKMGRWLGALLEAQSVPFVSMGRDRAADLPTLTQNCQVIVVSVPITDTLEVIRQIGPHVPEEGLLMDLTSVKREPLAEMMKQCRAQVVGAHPLFGPDTPDRDRGRVVLCPGRGEEGLAWVKDLFERAGIGVLLMDANEHDRMMGMIQGVQHFATLSLALTLCRSGLDLEAVKRCATSTFRSVLDRISAMTNQSSQLFQSLLMDNAYAARFMEAYLKTSGDLYRIVEGQDRKTFETLFHDLKERFQEGDKKNLQIRKEMMSS
jgi:prephenate dehydrogenase